MEAAQSLTTGRQDFQTREAVMLRLLHVIEKFQLDTTTDPNDFLIAADDCQDHGLESLAQTLRRDTDFFLAVDPHPPAPTGGEIPVEYPKTSNKIFGYGMGSNQGCSDERELGEDRPDGYGCGWSNGRGGSVLGSWRSGYGSRCSAGNGNSAFALLGRDSGSENIFGYGHRHHDDSTTGFPGPPNGAGQGDGFYNCPPHDNLEL